MGHTYVGKKVLSDIQLQLGILYFYLLKIVTLHLDLSRPVKPWSLDLRDNAAF